VFFTNAQILKAHFFDACDRVCLYEPTFLNFSLFASNALCSTLNSWYLGESSEEALAYADQSGVKIREVKPGEESSEADGGEESDGLPL
jgi:hypothetical protein